MADTIDVDYFVDFYKGYCSAVHNDWLEKKLSHTYEGADALIRCWISYYLVMRKECTIFSLGSNEKNILSMTAEERSKLTVYLYEIMTSSCSLSVLSAEQKIWFRRISRGVKASCQHPLLNEEWEGRHYGLYLLKCIVHDKWEVIRFSFPKYDVLLIESTENDMNLSAGNEHILSITISIVQGER